MKKLLAILSLASVATFVHAQGWIEYYGSAANVQTNTAIGTAFGGTGTGGTFGKTAAAGGTATYDYELLYATTSINGSSAPTNSAWSAVLNYNGGSPISEGYATNGAAPGAVWGPGGTLGTQVNLVSGTAYTVELVGWSASLGSFSQVLADITADSASTAGFLGWETGSITPAAAQGGDPAIFPGTLGNGTLTLNAFPVTVAPSPEPTTVALAGLGGLALLGLRRKK